MFTQLVLQIVSTPTTVPQWHANVLSALFLMNSIHTNTCSPYVSSGSQMQYIRGPFLSLLHPPNQILQIPTTQTLQKMDFSRETDCKYPLSGLTAIGSAHYLLSKCDK